MKHHADLSQIPPKNGLVFPPNSHHSWADWDFSNDKMFLDTALFISPPSSLKRSYIGEPGRTTALCKHASTLNLPTGQLETYIRREAFRHMYIHLRSQQPVGVASHEESYFLWFDEYGTRLFRWTVDGSKWCYPSFDYLWPGDEWVHLRVSWWVGIDLYCAVSLCVKLEALEDGVWVDKGTATDEDNWASDTGIARCGLSFVQGPIWADDTIIRGPA